MAVAFDSRRFGSGINFSKRFHVSRGHSRHCEERFVRCCLNGLQAAERAEQRLSRDRTEACDVVERRLEALLLAEALARTVRESMRFVAGAREKEHRSRVALQRD